MLCMDAHMWYSAVCITLKNKQLYIISPVTLKFLKIYHLLYSLFTHKTK